MAHELIAGCSGHYILDPEIGNGHVPVEVTDFMAWARWFEKSPTHTRRVALTDLGTIVVSTVFLALDHKFGTSGPPILFETMVFHGERFRAAQESVGEVLDCKRWTTWEDAEIGHREVVKRWEDKIE